MATSHAVDIPPFAASEIKGLLNVPTKKIVILLRWPVVIICSYLLLSMDGKEFEPAAIHIFIPLYLLSNIFLNYLDQKLFESPYFYIPLLAADLFFLTASLIISGQTGTDFYLAYFLIIMLAALIQSFHGLVMMAVTSTLVYAYFLFKTAPDFESSMFLRLPFLFLVALFCGYFAQVVRREKLRSMARVHELRSELLNVVSHELRTPLNVIIGTAWVLQEKKLGEMNTQQAKAVERIANNSRELLEMVNMILEASKVETGALTTNREEFYPSVFLNELKTCYDMVATDGPDLTWDYPSRLPLMKTDKVKLRIILQNLINNAVKFTPSGEVAVSARPTDAEKGVEFTVADTGIGIAKESIPYIFEMFYQADSSATRAHSGVGLGLYIVKTFTELLGGKLSVASERGKGSSFTVSLRCG